MTGACGDCHYTTQWPTSVSVATFHGTGAVCSRCHDPVPPVISPVTYVPISVDDITIVIPVENRKVVPADPGETGDASVVGVDVDGNGMRDDVQRFINLNYWKDGNLKYYAESVAKSQLDLINIGANSGSPDQARNAMNEMDKFAQCLGFRFPLLGREVIGNLAAAVLSTKDRAKAYFAGVGKANGQILYGQDAVFHSETCR